MRLSTLKAMAMARTAPPPILKKHAMPHKKGHCRHCGKRIGRGVNFHERACKKK